MPTSGERFAVDTSVAVAALDAAHVVHKQCRTVVQRRRPGLAGHAAFETLSVLTRMPGPLAIDVPEAAALITRVFPVVHAIGADEYVDVLRRFGRMGCSGGAIYDALVGEAARSNDCVLISRDQRARRTYDLLGVEYEMLDL